MLVDIRECITKLDINAVKKAQLLRIYEVWSRKIKQMVGISYDQIPFIPLALINKAYGNEELLRQYANLHQDLYAIIEHGVFFGNNKAKVGDTGEWVLGCILTNGEYRKELINQVFPDYYCEMIGPMIHYAKTDLEYYKEIKERVNSKARTMTFFPAHGLKDVRIVYDTQSTIKKIVEMADNYGCGNILLCAFPHDVKDFEQIIIEMKLNKRVVVVTSAGKEAKDFLPRQRAIIESSDLTASNSLGTHLGYCVYLNKPHILLPEKFLIEGDPQKIKDEFGAKTRSDNWKLQYDKEVTMFQKAFSINEPLSNEEQWKLCDYYWGFTKVKSPDEIRQIYQECHSHSIQFMKEKIYQRKYSS